MIRELRTAANGPGESRGVVVPLVPWVSLPFVVAFLVVGFGDGLGYALRDQFGLPSPHLLMLPALALFILLAHEASPRLDLRRASERVFLPAIVSLGWVILQQSTGRPVDLLGFAQFVSFLILASLVRKLFEAVPQRITEAFLGAIAVIHYLQCSYIVFAAVFSWLFGVDLNLMHLFQPLEVSEAYGIRHAGFSREPSWAAYSIASTYLGIHYLRPALRLRALIAFGIAVAFINSGTGYFLVSCFAAAHAFERESSRSWLASGSIVLCALSLLTYLEWDRLVAVWSGMDASLLMRGASVTVAFQVIADTFPIGTGWGNFQGFGIYGAEFDTFIDLAQADFYKSDVLALNLVAELGLFGFGCIAWIAAIFRVRGRVLPSLLGLTLLTLFGTALVPAIVGIAATNGLLASGRILHPSVRRREPGPGRLRAPDRPEAA